jgi:hypothetical protein
MRNQLKALLVAAGAATAAAVPATMTAPAASAATTPAVYASAAANGWSHPGVRPAWIFIGMGGAPVAHVGKWSTWDKGEPQPHASANGTLQVNNCQPNCAQGRITSHRLVVTLSVVKTHLGVRYYSRMTWSTPGYRLSGERSSIAVLHYSSTDGGAPYWH